jgi:hypothetical protein
MMNLRFLVSTVAMFALVMTASAEDKKADNPIFAS